MTAAEFIYTVLLRPKPLRTLSNSCLRAIIPPRVERHGAIIVLNPNDPVVSGAITLRVYEPAETRFLMSALRPGITFLDIGANIGYYTALAVNRVGPSGQIIALEPDPDSFSYLKKTVEANGANNVICIKKAAADRAGVMTLYASRDNRGDNRLYVNESSQYQLDVEVTTIDALMADYGWPSVDVVKMDVQGFEGYVISGMIETLCRSKKLVLMTEFWPDGLRSSGTDPHEPLRCLTAAGLSLYELQPAGRATPLTNTDALIQRHPGRRYTTIVGVKGTDLPH